MPNYPTTAEIVRAARLYGDVFTAASTTGVIPRSRALIANSGDIYIKATGDDGNQAVFFCPQGVIMDIETTVLLCSKDGSTYTPPVSSLSAGDMTYIQ